MVQTFAISEKTTLKYLRENFNLQRSEDPDFFTEWKYELPNLKPDDSAILSCIKNRYFYQLDEGIILEEGVMKKYHHGCLIHIVTLAPGSSDLTLPSSLTLPSDLTPALSWEERE